MKIAIERLAFHAAHACNLSCESCAHYSNYGFAGLVAPADIERELAPWAQRLRPITCNITGGEPTLNPRLSEIVRIARRLFPRSQTRIITNGFFLHRVPGLLDAVLQTGCDIQISEHGRDPEYTARFAEIRALADNWRARGARIEIFPYLDNVWLQRYEGYGPTMTPFADGDATTAWHICRVRHCLYAHAGKLWKCPPLAFLPMLKEKFPELPAVWDPYLAYEPLSPEASAEELSAFVGRGPEAACGMCPAQPRRFNVPSPLISARALLRERAPAPPTSV